MVIGACLWIPQGLWTELGGFPEWFESIAEDMYLCCRADWRVPGAGYGDFRLHASSGAELRGR